MYKCFFIVLVLALWSCASNPETRIQVTNVEILEAGLLGLIVNEQLDSEVAFNERSFENKQLFSNLREIPENIAGLAVMPLEYIFTHLKGIGLHSLQRKLDIYEVVFWDYGKESYLVVELNSQLEAIKVERKDRSLQILYTY